MSEDNIEADTSCCASCGIVLDEVKLKACADCDLVRYCSDTCQREHTSQHKEACKKQAAELRDEILFKQPESNHWGDCPICCLPLPLDMDKSTMMACCSKLICDGCSRANKMIREVKASLDQSCPFCRRANPKTDEVCYKYRMKRIEANDPAAMSHKGIEQYRKGDYQSALTYFTKAARLGYAEAHHQISIMYHYGHGVEKDKVKEIYLSYLYNVGKGVEKDRGKEIYHMEEAAIGGHPNARHNLGIHEWNNDNKERAVKHWIIAANQGDDDSIKALMKIFKKGFVSKDDLAAALRAHQAAVDATKSPQRNAAEQNYRPA